MVLWCGPAVVGLSRSTMQLDPNWNNQITNVRVFRSKGLQETLRLTQSCLEIFLFCLPLVQEKKRRRISRKPIDGYKCRRRQPPFIHDTSKIQTPTRCYVTEQKRNRNRIVYSGTENQAHVKMSLDTTTKSHDILIVSKLHSLWALLKFKKSIIRSWNSMFRSATYISTHIPLLM